MTRFFQDERSLCTSKIRDKEVMIMKKVILLFATVFTVANMLVAVSINANAAECESTNGQKCSGQCCVSSATECKAGPCDAILG